MAVAGTQLYGDMSLLDCKSYEDYLDAAITTEDVCYLRNLKIARQISELGYRRTGETLDRNTFYQRAKAVKDIVYPIQRPYELTSEFVQSNDKFLQELALRENANRLGYISTIIFLRNSSKHQSEVSGYIDFKERLTKENLLPIFQGKKKLWPQCTDLAFYNWKTEKSYLNKTLYYEPLIDQKYGLVFKNRNDRRIIIVNPKLSPGRNTTRIRIYSTLYKHVILYDHVVQNPF
ncbi:cilia- and flagella-associated protein 299-like [Prorops nasuta]|uniref:cilia- and flagella-associated protein 299-like n=1 Tax=Prorops nasuta TaxID=863751 RepID=UPI0034CFB9CB